MSVIESTTLPHKHELSVGRPSIKRTNQPSIACSGAREKGLTVRQCQTGYIKLSFILNTGRYSGTDSRTSRVMQILRWQSIDRRRGSNGSEARDAL